jgi:hypothetical protein
MKSICIDHDRRASVIETYFGGLIWTPSFFETGVEVDISLLTGKLFVTQEWNERTCSFEYGII